MMMIGLNFIGEREFNKFITALKIRSGKFQKF